MKLVIATHNPAKFTRYQQLLSEFPNLKILSLTDLGITEKITEPHETAEENARHKVREYARLTNLPTLSIDEAAHTNFLPEDEQPGVYVRRIADRQTELTDEETLAFWQETLKRFSQANKQIVWDFRIAYKHPSSDVISTTTVTMPSTIAETFSKTIVPGYPMSSFLIPVGQNVPWADLTIEEKNAVEKAIFAPFIEAFSSWITS